MSDKKKSIVRWERVGPALAALVILALVIFFFLDPFAKWAIIKAGQGVFGARVTIDSVKIRLRDSSIRLRGMQVADKSSPMQNLFQFDEAMFDFRTLPLLEKRVIIDQASVNGLRFGTPRKTSGALTFEDTKPGFVGKAMDRVWGQVQSVGVEKFEGAKKFYDPKTVVNPDALSSVKAADKAQDSLKNVPGDLQKQIDALKAQERANQIQKQIEGLGQGSSDAAAILRKASQVKSIQQEISALRSDVANTQKSVTERIQAAQTEVENVKKAKEQDWAKIRSTLSLPTLDKGAIASALFGPSVARWLERGLGWVHEARSYMPPKPKSPPPPPRGRSRVIEFPREHALPRFLLAKAQLSGELGREKPFGFSGTLEGITTNPPLYGKPATLRLSGAQGARSFNATATIDHTRPEPMEALQGAYNGFALSSLGLGQSGSLGITTGAGTGRVQASVQIRGEALAGNVEFQAGGLSLAPKLDVGKSATAQRISSGLTSSLAQVHSLTAGVALGGTIASPSFSVQSNVGDIVSSALRQAVGGEVEQQEKALRAELDRQTDSKIQALQGNVNTLQHEFLSKLGANYKIVDDLLDRLRAQAVIPGSSGKRPLDAIKGYFGH